MNTSEPVNCRLYPESYRMRDLGANVVEMVLGTIIKVICFLLPLIIPLKAFWIVYKAPKVAKVSQLDNLNINDSFVSHEEDKNFWNSLKFKMKAVEKSTNDDWILTTENQKQTTNAKEPEKDKSSVQFKDEEENNNVKKSNTNVSRSSETDEEEKSPISMISKLNANLQKSLQKKNKIAFGERKWHWIWFYGIFYDEDKLTFIQKPKND